MGREEKSLGRQERPGDLGGHLWKAQCHKLLAVSSLADWQEGSRKALVPRQVQESSVFGVVPGLLEKSKQGPGRLGGTPRAPGLRSDPSALKLWNIESCDLGFVLSLKFMPRVQMAEMALNTSPEYSLTEARTHQKKKGFFLSVYEPCLWKILTGLHWQLSWFRILFSGFWD